MPEKTFGHKKPGAVYKERVGAYGIGFETRQNYQQVKELLQWV